MRALEIAATVILAGALALLFFGSILKELF